MNQIPLTEVVYDQSIYPRAEWSQATVNRYAEAINAGDEFPPIVLEADTNRLLDGMHRWQAHKQALKDTIRVRWETVPEGVPPKAYAASLSVTHGDRITSEDLKTIAREVATENPDYDQKTLARLFRVTRQTVSRWTSDIVEHRRNIRRAKAVLLSRAGWSQRQIAGHLNVSQQTVTNDVKDDIIGHLTEGLIREALDGLTSSFDGVCELPEELLDRCQAAAEEIRQEQIFATWSDEERSLLKQLRSGQTIVVTLRGPHNNLIEWADAAGLYMRIDRRSEWGNPFEMPADGDRDTVIRHYAEHYLPYKPSLLGKLDTLTGKALGCWCAPEPCHGDVLKEATEQ